MLVVGGGQDGKLLNNDENRSTNRDENLTHHKITNRLVRTAEVNHQSLSKDVQRDRNVESPLEATSPANDETDSEQKEAGYHVESVANVTSLRDTEVIDYLQKGCVVVVPAVVRELVCRVEQACTDDSSVGQKTEVEHRGRSKAELPNKENAKHNKSEHDHGNDVA